ncbi:NAD(P)/FAD-dependent oxidoreductase [Streptomyces sp. RB6PN25]|uniref:NAD(P)/FAD-dependent oxidoreductase n=1 Tax=Streptomyces humicola TaxID=2953240 RepID=A0ABT1PV63_9ACTN|nr:NAD(P)/FAD-dependent oxidoreductase [Streptomyces humicola]MCQ4081537.1 NAD(P)/FAD-dependent oxidoreductase [Streptomyces humicola]
MARIAVVGAGMGSLATAARLAAQGHRVAVYERAATYGGGVGRFEREGFVFDTGPGLLHLPAVYRDLFVKTGKGLAKDERTLEQCVELTQIDPAVRHLLPDGRDVSLPNASRAGVVAALDEAFGAGAGERWGEVMNRAREVWEVTRRPLLEDTLSDAASALARDPYPARRGGLLRRDAPVLDRTARCELRDPGLVALLGSHALAYGYDPRTAPASAAILAYVEQTFGAWYVRGGIRALADAVHRRCVAHGVEFHFGAEVTAVVEKDGRATGIELDGGIRAEADAVVDGTARLDGDGAAEPPSALGRFTVLLALRGGRSAGTVHRTIVHGSPTVTVLRPDDPALRPDDEHEAVTVTVAVPPQGPVDWAAPGYAEGFAERVVEAAQAAVPGLAQRILWREVRTPLDTERETGVPGGAVPGPVLAGAGGALLRPGNRGVLEGLYRVGGCAHPGGGLPHSGMSGAIVADLIAGGPGGSR